MTPAEVYQRVISRGESMGLKLSESAESVRKQPATASDRAFNVIMRSDSDTNAGRESRDRRMKMQSSIIVETVHSVAAAKGKRRKGVESALDDELSFIQAMNAESTLLQGNTRVAYGGAVREFITDGTFLLTTMTWAVEHYVPLTGGGGDT